MRRPKPLVMLAATALGAVGCFPSLPPDTPDASADGQVGDGTEALDGAGDGETPPDAAPDTAPDAAVGDVSDPDCSELDGPCATGSWSTELGRCVAVFKDDDTICDDDDACTLETVCRAGQCVGTAKACSPTDACHVAGRCEPSTGECVPVVGPDGVACELDDPCASEAECRSGVCTLTVAAVDEDDWVVPLPAGFEVGFVAAGEEAGRAVFAGFTDRPHTAAFSQSVEAGHVVLGHAMGDTLIVDASVPWSGASAPPDGAALRPHLSADGDVTGYVALLHSETRASIDWFGPERVQRGLTLADMEALVVSTSTTGAGHHVLSRSNPAGHAFAMTAEGCISTSQYDPNADFILYPTGLVPRTTCPPAGSDSAVFLVSIDLRSLLYTEAVLPLRHQIVAFVPNDDGHLPVPKAVDVSADGSVGLLVEYRGALVTPSGDIVAPARGLSGASADVNLALAQFAPDGTLADVIAVVGTREERGVGLAVSPELSQLLTIETLSPELTIFRGEEPIGRVERPTDRTPPQSVVLLRVSPTGQVDWTHRIDAVDGAKPELKSWPADFSPSRGARLALGAASGQGIHFDTNRAPVAAPLVSIHWVDFAPNGELFGRQVVYSARDPHSFFRFSDAPSFRGGGFAPVGATTAGLLHRPYTGPSGFDVLRIFFDFALNQYPQDMLLYFNSNDRVRCSSH